MPPRSILAAFGFLTRVPVPGFPFSEEELRWSSAHFPLVGAALGLALAALHAALAPAGPGPASAAVLTASLLLTGAFHEDGLADTADALGGSFDRPKLFDILKDPRVGSFGAAALGASLLVRWSCLAALGPAAPAALILSQCMARLPPVWLMVALPYVSTEGKGKLVARAGAAQAAVASLWTAGAVAALVAWGGLAAAALLPLAAAALAATLLCAWRFVRRAGGLTGDFLGATEQVVEGVLLLTLASTRGW